MSDMLRITGMASGLDVDTMVKTMMKAENTKLDKVRQNRQTTVWKQEAYREILGDINKFKSTYFDVLKKDTYLLSSSNYSNFDTTSSDATVATATAGLTGAAGSYSLKVDSIATSAEIKGSSLNSEFQVTDIANWQGKNITFNVSGTSQTLNIGDSGTVTDSYTLAKNINSEITKGALKGKISATVVSEGGNSFVKLTPLANSNAEVTATTVTSDLTTGKLNTISSSTKLSTLDSNSTKTFKFNYNGEEFSVSLEDSAGTKTVSDLITAINTASSGKVNAKFDDITGKFTLKTLDSGSSNLLSITDGTLVSGLGLNNAQSAQGSDAVIKLTEPGSSEKTLTQTSNKFTINGMTYNISKVSDKAVDFTVSTNSKSTFDKIKGFVDKYNELIDKINTETGEKKLKDYVPLTDEQKEEMSEDEIKAWESKAKQGILRNDSNLQNMLSSMRSAFFAGVEGSSVSLASIGLNTSSDYTKAGKIIVDEGKLKSAIESNGEEVAKLFTKQSTSEPTYNANLNSSARSTRSREEGIFQRINDILLDYTRTTRDSNNKKGMLLEKAGIQGDFSEYNNILTTEIKNQDKTISELLVKLNAKETRYYTQFSKLETAMYEMNNQSTWLSQQLGTS